MVYCNIIREAAKKLIINSDVSYRLSSDLIWYRKTVILIILTTQDNITVLMRATDAEMLKLTAVIIY